MLDLVMVVVALLFGVIILVQSAGKDWRGWGVVICLAIALLLGSGTIKL